MTKINKMLSAKFRTPNPQEVWIDEGLYVQEIVNHPDYPAFSLARCRLPAGKSTQCHRLDVNETYIIEQGFGLIRIGEETFPVEPGDNIPIGKGTPQNITNTSDSDLVFLVVCIQRFQSTGYQAIDTKLNSQ